MSDTTASIDASSTKQPTEKGWAIAKRAAAKAQQPESYRATHARVSTALQTAGLPRRDANSAATAVARLSKGERLSPGDIDALNTAIQTKGGKTDGKA